MHYSLKLMRGSRKSQKTQPRDNCTVHFANGKRAWCNGLKPVILKQLLRLWPYISRKCQERRFFLGLMWACHSRFLLFWENTCLTGKNTLQLTGLNHDNIIACLPLLFKFLCRTRLNYNHRNVATRNAILIVINRPRTLPWVASTRVVQYHKLSDLNTKRFMKTLHPLWCR